MQRTQTGKVVILVKIQLITSEQGAES